MPFYVTHVICVVILMNYLQKAASVDCDDNCKCSVANVGLYVDCQNKNLVEIPSVLDTQAYVLLLSSNKIVNVTRGYFKDLQMLDTLYLQQNEISYIEPRSFERLFSLTTLILNSNRLEHITAGVFAHLPSLRQIDLSGNLITRIDRRAFFTLPALSVINLGGNPLECTCEEKALANWLNYVGGISIISGQCTNFNAHQLMSLSTNRDLPDCSNDVMDSIFLQNLNCYSCNKAAGVTDCRNSGEKTRCQGSNDVCLQGLDYISGQLSVYGWCQDYKNCMQLEKENAQTCDGTRPSNTSCTFCSFYNLSNGDGKSAVTKAFDIQVSVTLNKEYTAALRDTTSTAYSDFEQNVVSDISKKLKNKLGAYIVNFQQIVVPQVTTVVHVHCSSMWFVKQAAMTGAVITALVGSQIAGATVVVVQIAFLSDNKCPPEVLETDGYGVFRWPESEAGFEVYIKCPYTLSSGNTRLATRRCSESTDGVAEWQQPKLSQCPSDRDLTRSLQSLTEVPITDANVAQVSTNVSELSNNWQDYQPSDIHLTVSVIEAILATTSSKSERSVIQNTLSTANNILNIDTNTLSEGHVATEASTRLIAAVDSLLEGVDVTTADFSDVRDNIAGFTSSVSGRDFTGLSLHVDVDGESPLQESKVRVEKTATPVATGQSGIVVPQSVFNGLTNAQKRSIGKVAMTTYKDANLFSSVGLADMGDTTERTITTEDNETVSVTREINSHVLGASVPNIVTSKLGENVTVTFRHLKNATNPECVYWDVSAKVWDTKGCALTQTGDSNTVCSCNHLTNFALLMDVYASGGGLSEANRLALSIISYIGCAISLLAMCLTLLTYACFRKIRKDNPGKILMNLCVAIALADLIFVVGMQDYASNSDGACKFVAAVLHYFLLAMMCWMLVEAFYMYLALVKVFDTFIPRFQLKSSLFGWGVPLVIVAVTLGVNSTDNYGLQPGNICWLSRIPFYAAFLAPMCLTIILNSICFVFVMRQIIRRGMSKLTKTEKSQTAIRLRGAVSIVVLLGLTWIFAIFAVGDFGIVFHYLFAIFNSLQGLFIFIFYCFLKPDVRKAWRRTLPCLNSEYEAGASSSNSKGYSEATNNKSTMKTGTMESNRTETSSPSSTLETTVSKTSTQTNKAYRGNWQLSTNKS